MASLPERPPWPVFALLAALLLSSLSLFATPPAAPAAPGSVPGWTAGRPAAGMADALAIPEPMAVALPEAIAAKITGDTAIFYFSPLCPHCQVSAPEIAELSRRPGLAWLGVATGSTMQADLDAYRAEYGLDFEVLVDADRGFARALGAKSTPSLYLARPDPAASAASPGTRSVLLFEAYTPWRRGLGGYLRMRRHPEEPFREFEGYQSDATCGSCHTEEMGSWLLTHHAVAWRTLVVRERADDQRCVSCHVTGLGQGGFAMGDLSSPFVDVSCEACHGPSGPHDGERTDARAACVGCHDAKHSVAFSVEKGWSLIDHYRINALSEAEIDARLTALARGDAERPLLAFPEGPTVGAAACQSCHKAEHKRWKQDPHGEAMASLTGPDRENPACVACHATARASGPPAATLDGYRMDEGVGCESCHGPGGAHVAKPTRDNIVGLGESCPECVIESICTSCHTPAWDPGWDLKTRLAGARHVPGR